VEVLSCRLLPYAVADGATNMAADEVLVRWTAESGQPAFRLYGWTRATVSLGYFQPAAARLSDAHLAGLPWVRRPSGGATLVHHHELTYALAVPPSAISRSAKPWLIRMHETIAAALTSCGVLGLMTVSGRAKHHGDVLCFEQFTPGDVLCGGKKVVGSAQRKYHQALLQHGGILLAQSEYTPTLPGIAELTGVRLDEPAGAALIDALAKETGWQMQPSSWSGEEQRALATVRDEKYANKAWNERR
jgi:lipoyl(octanoyl) transferase